MAHSRIADYLRWTYPGISFLRDVRLRDDGDGVLQIDQWNIDAPVPTDAEIEAAVPAIDAAIAESRRRLVPKYRIVDRLIAAGLLAAARAVLDAQPMDVQERWNARTEIYADDETALTLLRAIGADPAQIMAP